MIGLLEDFYEIHMLNIAQPAVAISPFRYLGSSQNLKTILSI